VVDGARFRRRDGLGAGPRRLRGRLRRRAVPAAARHQRRTRRTAAGRQPDRRDPRLGDEPASPTAAPGTTPTPAAAAAAAAAAPASEAVATAAETDDDAAGRHFHTEPLPTPPAAAADGQVDRRDATGSDVPQSTRTRSTTSAATMFHFVNWTKHKTNQGRSYVIIIIIIIIIISFPSPTLSFFQT